MPNDKLNIPFDALQYATAGSIVYPPGGRFGPRIQQDLQLVMLYTGEMSMTIDQRQIDVLPGQLILLKPGHEETFIFSKTEQSWHRWISVHVTELTDETREALYQLPECIALTKEMNHLTDLMLDVQRHVPNDDSAMLSLGLTAIHLFPIESKRVLFQKEKHPAIYSTLMWINEHYSGEITLEMLAIQACLSPEHLLRIFKSNVQSTPIRYLWEYRVNKAIELITSTGLTISEIAHRCGFKTSHHLARLVKQHTGKTATEIRQLSWSGLRN
ncbi:AraC family transcriptional regulator of arabinose operon [Paenibacillus castaneae]|uniref:AraC family transcriptional regulator n=1 Tax=Paenibacillus castaneae TaxID=474957 RepID=UPI001FBB397D|nr:AraC family transcriptional regulator [Paenibacillus castaneae]NIK78756.1 AraC family transcriptional regulator of arabinose operon [Paenibacillus castaneae]